MKQLGLIGNPISHSQSPALFDAFFKQYPNEFWSYNLYPLNNIEELEGLIAQHPNLCGLNVTIPFKKQVLPLMKSLDISAASTGAVNTIYISREYNTTSLTGYNTDVTGFEKSLLEFGVFNNCHALILGNGGASLAVQFVLNKLNIPFIIISRTTGENHIDYQALHPALIQNSKLIINTTPLGMWPNVDTKPEILYSEITAQHFCFDLVYNPAETAFMAACKKQGATVCNGKRMLELQAKAAWEIFRH